MHLRRSVWFSLSAVACASWFSAASTVDVRPPVAPIAPYKPSAVDHSVAGLQAEVSRLHERLAPSAVPARSRDLFRFSARVPERPQPARPSLTPAPAPVAPDAPVSLPVRPLMKLIGIAEEGQDDGTVRTAVVSGFGDVFLVKAGETLHGQYRVDLVSADAVQLTDTATNLATTLALR